MARSLTAEAVASSGFALIPRFAVGATAVEAASLLGDVDPVEGLDPVQTLVPRNRAEAPPNTYSGLFGRSEFPLHTDLAHWARPPRFLVLRCVYGTSSVGTRVFDGKTLLRHFGASSLRRALVHPRRPMRNGRQLLRLLQGPDTSEFHLRWDSVYLQPASKFGAEVCESLRAFLLDLSVPEVPLVNPGDTLVLDNWRCLHGRSEVPQTALHRFIERVYLRGMR